MHSLVFEDLEFDDAPLERFEFDAGSRRGVLRLDAADGERVELQLLGLLAQRFGPMPDRRPLQVSGAYRRSVLQCCPSPWIAELRSLLAPFQETIPKQLKHFIVPSDEGVWEFLAVGIERHHFSDR